MYILILIISLKSQFNHALDVKTVDGIGRQDTCMLIGEKISIELKSFNKDVETKYYCEVDSSTRLKKD